MSKRRPDIIARGPQMVFKPGTWQAEHFRGLPKYESVLEGQYFPEGAGQEELDALAERRRELLSYGAAAQATSAAVPLELPEREPAPEPQASIGHEAVAA